MEPLMTSSLSGHGSARLVFADGTTFTGVAFGATATVDGEVVFNTSMTGYPELLTDPSYRRQILTLTYPEIGNYGVCRRDFESTRVQASALVVRSLSPVVSNWRSEIDLSTWLKDAGVPGISGIDTRALVRKLRDGGTVMGVVSTEANVDVRELRERAKSLPGMAGCELVSHVTCASPYAVTEGLVDDAGRAIAPLAAPEFHVVAFDFGMKANMARLLVHHGCRVTVVPASTTASEVTALLPDGILLSNGPGDPSTVPHVVDAVKSLLGRVPIFGICMGHQILGQALGASTYKTAFGHRGANQPVIDESSRRVLITSQNHGFAVRPSDFDRAPAATSVNATPAARATASERNLSDDTNEGLDASALFAFSVQYHPESAPGPHDAGVHFARFTTMMRAFKAQQASRKAS
jgi:carbamoyl-phosphate synthase small subunit